MFVLLFAGCAQSPEQVALKQANKLLDEGRVHAAMDAAESYLRQHPTSTALLRLRVIILLRAEEPGLAAIALRQVPDGKSMTPELLRHRDRIVRLNAAKLLADRPHPGDLSELVHAMPDPDPDMRRYCARALGRIGNPAALKPLFRLLSDDNWFVRAEAASALGKIGDARAIGWLVQLLADEDGYVRYSATSALYDLATPSSHALLLRALGSAEPAQKLGVAIALTRLHDPAALAPLTGAVNNSDTEIRQRAVEALRESGLAESTNALALYLKDPDPGVREHAQDAMGRIIGGRKP